MKKVKILYIVAFIFFAFAIFELVKANKLNLELKSTKEKLVVAQDELEHYRFKLDEYKDHLRHIEISVQDLEENSKSQHLIEEAEDIENDISILSDDMEDY